MEIPHAKLLTLSLFCLRLCGEANLHGTFMPGSAMGWYTSFPPVAAADKPSR
jgi:hypothetical protein